MNSNKRINKNLLVISEYINELELDNCRLRNSDEILNNVIEEKDKEIDRLNNIIKEAIEYHNNCIEENLDLDKIDDNEKLAYKVAYGIHKRYLEILDKGE